MERGFAPHHEGLIPPLREAVEEAFIKGLIKVVFATETLAVGVNMPAKSVVIEKLTKFNGEGHDILTPGEFTQLTGRAGRRGIDVAGHAIVEWNRFVDFEQAASLASTRSYALKSSFHPTYNMATNLISAYSPSHARHILNLSFAQYQADDAVVALERNLESRQNRMNKIREEFSQTDKQFATLVHKRSRFLDENKSSQTEGSSGDYLIRTLHAGDVLDGFKHLEPCVVITKGSPRGTQYVTVIDTHGRNHKLPGDKIDSGAKVVANIELPSKSTSRSQHFRISTSIALKKALVSTNVKVKGSKKKMKKTKVFESELIDEYIICQRDLKRLTKRVQSRGQSLARQFERLLALLSEYEYVHDWELLEKGQVLSRINSEADIVICELITSGELVKLSAPELAGLLSAFVFEGRGDSSTRFNTFPSDELERLCIASEKFIEKFNRDEREAGIKESRGLDYSMMFGTYLWAKGKPLDEILANQDITGGDFVRVIKSIVDLVRQIENATSDEALGAICRATKKACYRDIVEISS